MNVETSRERRPAGVVLGLVLVLALVFTGMAAAQGIQTGTLSGVVKSADGAPLPGVTVTLKSPALQGEHTAVTDSTGAYIFRGLPPGQGASTYTVTFSLAGFGTVERKVDIGLALPSEMNATLSVANVQESVEVTAKSGRPAFSQPMTRPKSAGSA